MFDLNLAPIDVVQIDDQDRLTKALARDVTTIEIGLLKKARKDPGVLTAAFHPLYAKIEAMPISDRSLLVDVGATQQHLLADYAGLTGLDEDLREFGIRTCAFIPVVADPESIQQAARQLEMLNRIIPSARQCLVCNERDGKFEDIAAGSEAARLLSECLLPLLKNIPVITMPKIEAGSWSHFERQHCRFLDVVGFDVQTAMAVSGLARPEAKLARGDVAAWMLDMEHAIASVLPLAGGGDHV